MAEEKSLHRMPSADCGDYEEIPLSQGARGRLWGLRRNPQKGKRNAVARSVPSNPDHTARTASHQRE